VKIKMATGFSEGSGATWKIKHPKVFSLSRNSPILPSSGGKSTETSGNGSLYTDTCKIDANITVYVSYIDGNDVWDGMTVESSVRSLNRAFEIVRSKGYNETATVKLQAGFYNLKDEVISLNSGHKGKQRCPVFIEGSKLEKQRDLYFTPELDQSDQGTITGLWTLKYPTMDSFEVYPGDTILNVPDSQFMQVVYADSNGMISTVRVAFNGELTPQRFLGTVFRHTTTTTNLCVSGTVEMIGKADRVCFKDIRVILDEGSFLKHVNLMLWMNNVYYVAKKGKNASVIFDTVKKLVVGERIFREFKMSTGGMPSEIMGAIFESQTSNLDITLTNSVLLAENLGTLDASLILRDSSSAIIKNSYLISTSKKSILYVCDLSNHNFCNSRLLNVQSDVVSFEDIEDFNRCSVMR
jgi:hypothetical protein